MARITGRFNVALFLFSAALGLFRFLLSEDAVGVPLEGLVISSVVDAIRFIVVLLISAYFVREFWNRLVSSLWDLRLITKQEAIAFILIIGILGG